MLNWLDIILLIILVITLILGIWKGLIKQLVGVLAVILGVVLAWMYYDQAGSLFKPLVTDDSIAHFIGFFIIFSIILLYTSSLTTGAGLYAPIPPVFGPLSLS